MSKTSLSALLVFSCLVIFTNGETTENQKRFIENSMACKAQYGIPDNYMENIDWKILSRNDNFKEFLVCIGNKQPFMDGKGMAQREIAKILMRENTNSLGLNSDFNIDPIVEKCTVQRDSLRDTAFEFFKCTFESVRGYSDGMVWQ